METRWKNGSVGHAHGMESPTGLGVALIGMLQKKTKKLSEGASPAWYLLHCIPLLADTLHVPTSLGAQLQILEKGHSWWGKLKKKPTCFFFVVFQRISWEQVGFSPRFSWDIFVSKPSTSSSWRKPWSASNRCTTASEDGFWRNPSCRKIQLPRTCGVFEDVCSKQT